MTLLIVAIVTTSFVGTSLGQVFGFGRCPSVTVQDNFDITKYMGTWYESRRFDAAFEDFINCPTASYTLLPYGSVKVNNTGYNFKIGRYVRAQGIAVQTAEPAKMEVDYSDAMPGGDYWVLSTDYNSYSVVWSCEQFLGIFNYQYAWILTREPEVISVGRVNRLYRFLRGLGINTNKFQFTSQIDCETDTRADDNSEDIKIVQ